MENELDGFAPKKMHPIALLDLTKYHQELKAKYSDVNAETLKINPDAVSVMEFSGYYAMNHSPGSFLTIDTNIHIRKGARDPIRDVTLILSIDGIASTRYAFTGAFDGTFLKQKNKLFIALDACSMRVLDAILRFPDFVNLIPR